jgi:singapore isolate B (sub-type 7) whole genome shotgun sequence assembly, scaffold_4
VKPQNPERSTYELQAYENHGVSVSLVCKAGKEEGETFVRAEVRNENALDVENLELQMIVPKYMQMQQKPLSSDVVPSHGEGVCTQLFRLRNNSDGEKETVVRLRVMFQLGKEEVNEMVQVSGFDDDA